MKSLVNSFRCKINKGREKAQKGLVDQGEVLHISEEIRYSKSGEKKNQETLSQSACCCQHAGADENSTPRSKLSISAQ